MPGTAFPDPNEDPHAAERDAIDDAERAHTGDLADAIIAAVESGVRSDGTPGGEEGRVARDEALERLRAHFLRNEPGVVQEVPPVEYSHISGPGHHKNVGGDFVDPGARVQKWADVAMWQAPEHEDPQRPKVTVSMCTPDPLGMMAMVNAQYTGRNLTSPTEVTDEERRDAWEAATVSRLSETPLEWIQWSINFENVSRAFTHQLVRTRMATYAQESQRFAVKDKIHDSVKLPPSLAGTKEWQEFQAEMEALGVDPQKNTPQEQLWRNMWDNALDVVETAVTNMVNSGMPAEDARGLLPTNILTRVHMRVDMKTLLNLAGMRLCTQAQFEWRAVFAALAQAIRFYGGAQPGQTWQYDLIADSFRPICYAAGKCTMKARSDRFCSIRAQVDEFEKAGIPSNGWHSDGWRGAMGQPLDGIKPYQWLADPTAARVAPGQEK